MFIFYVLSIIVFCFYYSFLLFLVSFFISVLFIFFSINVFFSKVFLVFIFFNSYLSSVAVSIIHFSFLCFTFRIMWFSFLWHDCLAKYPLRPPCMVPSVSSTAVFLYPLTLIFLHYHPYCVLGSIFISKGFSGV